MTGRCSFFRSPPSPPIGPNLFRPNQDDAAISPCQRFARLFPGTFQARIVGEHFAPILVMTGWKKRQLVVVVVVGYADGVGVSLG